MCDWKTVTGCKQVEQCNYLECRGWKGKQWWEMKVASREVIRIVYPRIRNSFSDPVIQSQFIINLDLEDSKGPSSKAFFMLSTEYAQNLDIFFPSHTVCFKHTTQPIFRTIIHAASSQTPCPSKETSKITGWTTHRDSPPQLVRTFQKGFGAGVIFGPI